MSGCEVCEWDGEVARTHDYTHDYYTHIIVREGEVFKGKTCSRRKRPRRKGVVERTASALKMDLL